MNQKLAAYQFIKKTLLKEMTIRRRIFGQDKQKLAEKVGEIESALAYLAVLASDLAEKETTQESLF